MNSYCRHVGDHLPSGKSPLNALLVGPLDTRLFSTAGYIEVVSALYPQPENRGWETSRRWSLFQTRQTVASARNSSARLWLCQCKNLHFYCNSVAEIRRI